MMIDGFHCQWNDKNCQNCVKIEAKFLHNLLSSNDFSFLKEESSEEAGRAQLTVLFCYNYSATEEQSCIRKLKTSNTTETLMAELKQMLTDESVLDFLV